MQGGAYAQQFMSLFVERDEALVLYVGPDALHAGLSGEAQPRAQLAHTWAQVEPTPRAVEALVRAAVLRGVMTAPAERRCVVCVDWCASHALRVALADAVLRRLRCPGLVLLESPAAAAVAASAAGAALVVQVGRDGEARVTPVLGGAVCTAAAVVAQLDAADGATLASLLGAALRRCPVDVRGALVAHVVALEPVPELLEAVRTAAGPALAPTVAWAAEPWAHAPVAWVGASLVGATLKSAPGCVVSRDAYVAGKVFIPQLSEVR